MQLALRNNPEKSLSAALVQEAQLLLRLQEMRRGNAGDAARAEDRVACTFASNSP